jgi:hypothetical protein
MKKIIVLCSTLLILTTVLLTGCSVLFHTTDAGQIVDKPYDFKDFTDIELTNAYQYEITQADTFSVVISAHEYVFDRVDIRQSGSTLIIGMRWVPFNNLNAKVKIKMPQLNKLTISGACEGNVTGFVANNSLEINLSGASRMDTDLTAGTTRIDISGASRVTGKLTAVDTQIKLSGASDTNMTLQTGNTTISVSGSSDVRGSLQAADCTFNLSGASSCNITGAAKATIIVASGASDFNSSGFTAQTADVKLTGASDASMQVEVTLSVDISGASTLNYTGNPAMGKIAVSGSSDLNHK